VKTDPADAQVFLRPYGTANGEWELLGRTPVDLRRISRGFKEYQITKDGYDPVFGFTGTNVRFPPYRGEPVRLERTLVRAGTTPPEMVRVEGGNYTPTISYFRHLEAIDLAAFLIDRFETSNAQYQKFVDAGGYREKKYWKHEFIEDGRRISWEDAVAQFTDKTGRSGPANWELGHYPEGQDEYPVCGISWYEASAFAEYAGKSLPSVYHWNKAAGVYDGGRPYTSMVHPMVENSNLKSLGAAPAGAHRGISPFGTFDMAGNVREWIWNGAPGRKYLLGGAWGRPAYLFFESPELLSPFDRSSANGFRCMKLLGDRPVPTAAAADLPERARSAPPPPPVSDEVFRIYSGYFAYDKAGLEPSAEAVDEKHPYYNRQRITFKAAYGAERVPVYLFFPKHGKPPYQTVLVFPGSTARAVDSVDAYSNSHILMFTKAGRAVVFPVYRGTLERPRVDLSTATLERDNRIALYKDLARTLDYLETRAEFDHDRIAYFGLSWGSWMAPVFGALEKRIKFFLLEGGGLVGTGAPEVNPVNFAPRHTTPTVLINGRYDNLFPLETSARPFMDLLGTPAQHKKLVLVDGGHVPPVDSNLAREMLRWLDLYLGPVK